MQEVGRVTTPFLWEGQPEATSCTQSACERRGGHHEGTTYSPMDPGPPSRALLRGGGKKSTSDRRAPRTWRPSNLVLVLPPPLFLLRHTDIKMGAPSPHPPAQPKALPQALMRFVSLSPSPRGWPGDHLSGRHPDHHGLHAGGLYHAGL